METKNAKITSTMLGWKNAPVMTYWLNLDYGGDGQSFGGITLSGEFGIEAIKKILEVLDIEYWENLPGTNIRVKATHDKVHCIGNFLTDKWLNLKILRDEYRIKEENK